MRNGISLSRICDYFRVDIELVRDFADFGLYPTALFDGEVGIEMRNLGKLRKIISLHQALGINKEGIEVILELRNRVAGLQGEVELLRNEVATLKRDSGNGNLETLERLGLLVEINVSADPVSAGTKRRKPGED
jgi:hypothetical protein